MKNELVMFNSPDAAHHRTNLSGWVSRHDRYFGEDERAARYDGCTHRECEDCGEPVEKGWLICPKCSEVRDTARYQTLPKETWDGVGMLYSQTADKYFSDWDEVEEYCEDEAIVEDKLRLVICEPHYLPLLRSDFGCDELPEDGELPDAVIHAIDEFNKVIRATAPVSWWPGSRAAVRSKDLNQEQRELGRETK
jgi:hypothetical protein